MADERIALDMVIETANAAGTLGELEQSVERLKEEIKGVEVGSKEFQKLSGAIQQTESKVKTLNKTFEGLEPQQIADSFAKVGEAVVGSFAAMQGASILFGEENEDLQESMMKAQAALSLAIGARMIAEGALQAKIAITFTRQKLATLATALETEAQNKNTIAKWLAVAASKALNLVLAANPLMLIVTALIAVTAGLITFAKDTKSAKAVNERFNISLEKTDAILESLNKRLDERIALMKAQGKDERIIRAARVEVALQELETRRQELAQAKKNLDFAIKENKGIEDALNNRIASTEALREAEGKLQVLIAEGRKVDKDAGDARAEEARARAQEAQDIANNERERQQEEDRRFLEENREFQAELAQSKRKQDAADREIDLEASKEHSARMVEVLQKQLDDEDFAREQSRIEQDKYKEGIQSISNSLINIYRDFSESQTNNERKMIRIRRDAALAQIAVDTASALASLTKGTEAAAAQGALKGGGIGGIIEGVAFYAVGLGRIIANIAAARNAIRGASAATAALGSGGGRSGGGGQRPSNTGGNLPSINRGPDILTGIVEVGGDEDSIKVFVTETDITDKQKRVERLRQASVVE